MGWMETRAVDERMRFVIAVGEHEEAFAAVCRRFGVSRRTGYKWLARYEDTGVEGLVDRSRAPHSHPQAMTAVMVERCLAVRRKHPTWDGTHVFTTSRCSQDVDGRNKSGHDVERDVFNLSGTCCSDIPTAKAFASDQPPILTVL